MVLDMFHVSFMVVATMIGGLIWKGITTVDGDFPADRLIISVAFIGGVLLIVSGGVEGYMR